MPAIQLPKMYGAFWAASAEVSHWLPVQTAST